MQVTVQHLAAGLHGWRDGPGPLHQRLADAVRSLAETGALSTGSRLPSERSLAQALGVSRNTVAAAYRRLAEADWLLVQRGTAPRVGTVARTASDNLPAGDPLADLFPHVSPTGFDLTIASPAAAPAVLDLLAHPAALLPALQALTVGAGYHPAGHPALLDAVAGKLQQDGIDAHPEEIVITNGAQQALSLIAETLHRPRRAVAVEALTYPGLLHAVTRRTRGHLVALPVGGTGLQADAAARLISATTPAAAYLTSFHNPTGGTLDPPGAHVLLQAATAAGTPLVEDRTLADLPLRDDLPPSPLAALQPDANVITIGSMSKLFWGGLRIGWIHTNRTLATHLRLRRRASDLGGPAPMQLVAAALLNEHHSGTRCWRTAALQDSLAALTRAIDDADVGWRYHRPAGGPNLWIQLPHPSARTFAARAARDGVPLVAGDAFAAHPAPAADSIRIPFYRPAAELTAAITCLADSWRRHVRSGHR